MRTTFTTMNQKILNNLNKLTSDLTRINESISSERQMSTPSDNPVNLVAALGLRTSLSEIKQYSTNLVYGSTFINVSENALQQMKEGLIRARVLALSGINGATGVDNKATMAMEIANIFDQAVTLANTQMNGKFIFGGYRTAGYNEIEPTPFIIDQADNYRATGQNLTTMPASLTSTVRGTGITGVADDALFINGTLIAPIPPSGGSQFGLFMDTASDAVDQINLANTGVAASLTTLMAGIDAVGDTADGTDSEFSFDLNGVNVQVLINDGDNAATVVSKTVDAINGVSGQTGILASIGDDFNGGGLNRNVVLQNMLAGDDSPILIENYMTVAGDAVTGLSDTLPGGQVADATHNTGQISLTSAESFVLTSDTLANPPDDTVLNALGLEGGGKGFSDEIDDGELVYGYRLEAGDLEINGLPIGASTGDGYSDIYADTSAMAKAEAINAASDQTGVTAVITPVFRLAERSVDAGSMSSGDLIINGIDIFDYTPPAEAIVDGDSDNVLLRAINARQDDTHFTASRDSNGRLVLTPVSTLPGINLHIETSANGESITHFNGGTPPEPQDKVYFGAVQLRSDRKFKIATPNSDATEPGLASIGLSGGEMTVTSITDQTGNVRYVGDKNNDIAVKIGKESTLDISKNGQSAVKNTGVFTALKNLENFLLGRDYTAFHSQNPAMDATAILDSGDTGLERTDELVAGDFTVTVTDNAASPPWKFAFSIGIDPAVDTLEDVASRIDGIPGITANIDSEGYLQVSVDDPDRYTVNMENDSSNFLDIMGLRQEDIQVQSLGMSLAAIDDAIQALNNNISDFGARANRITIQNQIYSNMELSTSESLSEAQDTDLLEALMQLQSKQTAYQAALSAAAQTLQISLVDYL